MSLFTEIQNLHEFIIEFYSRGDCFESNGRDIESTPVYKCGRKGDATTEKSSTEHTHTQQNENKRDLQHTVIEHKSKQTTRHTELCNEME